MQGRSREPDNTERAKQETLAPGSGRAMGRPPLPREIARGNRVVTFVTEQEKASLKQLARVTSQSLSAICHRFIAQGLACDERVKPTSINEE